LHFASSKKIQILIVIEIIKGVESTNGRLHVPFIRKERAHVFQPLLQGRRKKGNGELKDVAFIADVFVYGREMKFARVHQNDVPAFEVSRLSFNVIVDIASYEKNELVKNVHVFAIFIFWGGCIV